MKITLTQTAINALKKIQGQIKLKNEFSQKRFSPIVSQVIVEASIAFNDSQIEQLATQLVPAKGQKKLFLRRLEKLAEVMGEESILKLERSAKRNKKSQQMKDKNLQFPLEKC